MTTDPTATMLSVIALIVSVAALGFTGWHAVTAHLARTRPLPARFILVFPKESRKLDGIHIHNAGGSAASSIVITVKVIAKGTPLGNRYKRLVVPGVIEAGKTVLIESTRSGSPFPWGWYKRIADGKYQLASDDDPDAVHVVRSWAKVVWNNWAGNQRKGRIRIH